MGWWLTSRKTVRGQMRIIIILRMSLLTSACGFPTSFDLLVACFLAVPLRGLEGTTRDKAHRTILQQPERLPEKLLSARFSKIRCSVLVSKWLENIYNTDLCVQEMTRREECRSQASCQV